MNASSKVSLHGMRILQDDGTVREVTCGVNEIQSGGEFTFCGMAIPDSHLEIEGFEKIGFYDHYGSIKDITCPDCLKFIRYVKSLKES